MEKIMNIIVLATVVYLGSNVFFSFAGFPSESMYFIDGMVPSVGTMSAVCTGIFIFAAGFYLCCKYKKK